MSNAIRWRMFAYVRTRYTVFCIFRNRRLPRSTELPVEGNWLSSKNTKLRSTIGDFIWDNLPSHKSSVARKLIEGRGASLLALPPYSPDLNPIENAFAKMKFRLRKEKIRDVAKLRYILLQEGKFFSKAECKNCIENAGVVCIKTWCALYCKSDDTLLTLGRVYTPLDLFFGNHYCTSWTILRPNTNVSNICFRSTRQCRNRPSLLLVSLTLHRQKRLSMASLAQGIRTKILTTGPPSIGDSDIGLPSESSTASKKNSSRKSLIKKELKCLHWTALMSKFILTEPVRRKNGRNPSAKVEAA